LGVGPEIPRNKKVVYAVAGADANRKGAVAKITTRRDAGLQKNPLNLKTNMDETRLSDSDTGLRTL
jgi:hypothetical protein